VCGDGGMNNSFYETYPQTDLQSKHRFSSVLQSTFEGDSMKTSAAEIFPELLSELLFFYSKTRSVSFGLQYLALNTLSSLIPGLKTPVISLRKDLLNQMNTEVNQLLKNDIRQIRQGVYPNHVLKPESPTGILRNLPRVILDSYSIGRRRTLGKTTEFSSTSRSDLEELPRYYRRNFHFQTDGYLSERSAELYEYEVELLFSGTADAMRRLIIGPMKDHLNSNDGAGLKFLEIGAGTGRSTRFVKSAFPKARIVAADLSDPYLKVAQKKLSSFSKIDFIHADGAQLPFQNGEFDAVYSVFLFHELPFNARLKVLSESSRVLKKGGFLGFVDSIQKGDEESMNLLLDDFPKNFHEPFYRNYINHPMEPMIETISSAPSRTKRGFLSKAVWTV
jgi:ubiquinone/menaquinone biosynthesis C-methylase UbiE